MDARSPVSMRIPDGIDVVYVVQYFSVSLPENLIQIECLEAPGRRG